MSGLVGYGSSDDEDELPSERPAKVARTEARSVQIAKGREEDARPTQQLDPQPPPHESLPAQTNTAAPGPSIPHATSQQPTEPTTPASAPASPYTTERLRLQELTMPTVPTFSIPDSPPPPPTNSEEAATFAATTKKFERFLALKAQGVHFNDRLRKSASLRNPSLLPKLMEFAGIEREDSYASTLPEELGVPVRWREESYVENLVKVNEKREKRRLEGRDRLDFVAASSKSAGSSKTGTPNSAAGGGESRKTKFDKR